MSESTEIKKDDCVEEAGEESVLLFMATSAICITMLLLSLGFFAGFSYANWNQGEDRRDVAPEAVIADLPSNYLQN